MISHRGAYSQFFKPAPYFSSGRNRFHRPSALAFLRKSLMICASLCSSPESSTCFLAISSAAYTCSFMNAPMRRLRSSTLGGNEKSIVSSLKLLLLRLLSNADATQKRSARSARSKLDQTQSRRWGRSSSSGGLPRRRLGARRLPALDAQPKLAPTLADVQSTKPRRAWLRCSNLDRTRRRRARAAPRFRAVNSVKFKCATFYLRWGARLERFFLSLWHLLLIGPLS